MLNGDILCNGVFGFDSFFTKRYKIKSCAYNSDLSANQFYVISNSKMNGALRKPTVMQLQLELKPVYNDHPWEHNNMVFFHTWSFIAWSFMQVMRNWETKNILP